MWPPESVNSLLTPAASRRRAISFPPCSGVGAAVSDVSPLLIRERTLSLGRGKNLSALDADLPHMDAVHWTWGHDTLYGGPIFPKSTPWPHDFCLEWMYRLR